MQEKRRGRNWWGKYLAIRAKGESQTLACTLCNIPRKAVDTARAKHPNFAKQEAGAIERGLIVKQHRVPDRISGRPNFTLTPTQADFALKLYGETGNVSVVARIMCLSVSTLARYRNHTPDFNAQWEVAKARGAFMTAELGPWWKREHTLLWALQEGVSLEDAARAAHITLEVARHVSLEATRTPAQRRRIAQKKYTDNSPNPYTVTPGPRKHVVPAQIVQHNARAELRESPMARAEKALTPEQRAFLALLVDDNMTLVEAMEHAQRNEKEIAAWAEANVYFRGCVSE